MHQKIIRQILLMLCLFLSYNGVQGRKKLSKLEDMELEKQLKLLNKPAIKTVKTKFGESYDCVDFYKQHAFDHPLLKNHNFHPQMKPTFAEIKQNSYDSTTNKLPTIWSKDGGCPSGTIPIKRITKDDLIRQRNMPPAEPANFDNEFVGSNNNIEQKGSYYQFNGYKRAIAIPQYDPNLTKFSGAGMATSLYNPHVEGQQHSGCRIKIQKGSDILQVGWRVDPTLYGDNNTRLYLHYQTGETRCFNTLCPSFVSVHTDIPLDMSFEDNLSQRGGSPKEINLYIYRDTGNGNWWLLLGPDYTQVGFWPHNILNELKGLATNVDWGGVIYNPPGLPEPPMGSSFFPIGNTSLDAYCRSITVSNEVGDSVGIYNVVVLTENKFAYDIQFKGLTEGSNTITYVFYGGPGISNP
ncbi:protein neprosin-like [Solanum lycopersicum]|uniref:protein neprosin-like n=1 Tax=Solanum lycopersicum TaxID=4081 RepID=UPI003748B499